MEEKITWAHPEEPQTVQELVSVDKRWHISKTETNGNVNFFLSNWDILVTPHGTGTNISECFETFVADCNAYIEKVKKIRDEAMEYLNEME